MGCGGDSIQADSPVSERYEDFHDSAEVGDSILISDITDFEWDYLYVFGEGDKKSEVDDIIGVDFYGRQLPLVGSERIYDAGNLFIFVAGDEVVHAVSVGPADYTLFEWGHGYDPASATATEVDGGFVQLDDDSTSDG